mgnify:CR=1 FL=1
MTKQTDKNIWLYMLRFALVYAAAYIAASMLFINLQSLLPESSRVALDFFEPYRFELATHIAQLLLGALLALVLYPFYDLIVKGKNGFKIILCALWGVALLGNLEPKPGSIEGMIYTTTTFSEHLLVLLIGALQVAFFAWVFLRWEKAASSKSSAVLASKGGR